MSFLFSTASSLRTALMFAALIGMAYAPAALAQEATAAPAAATDQTDNTPQAKFIQSLGDKAVAILANKKISVQERNKQFRAMLSDSFDLNTIARFVIGRTWLSATQAQKDEYMDLFESLVVKTYSDRFALYTGEGFKVRNTIKESDRDSIVNSDITHPDGSPATTVVWRVREKNGKFGIIDVVVEGVSMSVTQRQEYSSVIQRNGGNIEGLLKLMRERVKAGEGVS